MAELPSDIGIRVDARLLDAVQTLGKSLDRVERERDALRVERDALRAALQSIADFRPKSEQPAWGGPYEQIAAYAKERARDALCAGAPAAGGEATGGERERKD